MIKKIIGKLRQKIRHLKYAREASEANLKGALYNFHHDKSRRVDWSDKIGPLVNRLTNWQRSQLARAGYPGGTRKDRDEKKIEPFTQLKKDRK